MKVRMKVRNQELLDMGKMGVGTVYSKCCCPGCVSPDRWFKKRPKNWKRITLRTFRCGR